MDAAVAAAVADPGDAAGVQGAAPDVPGVAGVVMKTLTALLAVFVALKLAGVIKWSWWLVTLPLTIPLFMKAVLLLIVGYVAVVTHDAQKGGGK